MHTENQRPSMVAIAFFLEAEVSGVKLISPVGSARSGNGGTAHDRKEWGHEARVPSWARAGTGALSGRCAGTNPGCQLGRFLAMNDGASELRVYDFEAPGIAFLGQGQKPMWSPGGGYLLVLSAGQGTTTGVAPTENAKDIETEAFVLPSVAPAARIDLGSVRDARWLPAQACDR